MLHAPKFAEALAMTSATAELQRCSTWKLPAATPWALAVRRETGLAETAAPVNPRQWSQQKPPTQSIGTLPSPDPDVAALKGAAV